MTPRAPAQTWRAEVEGRSGPAEALKYALNPTPIQAGALRGAGRWKTSHKRRL